jgi:type I restriction enzyme S subunit
MELTKGYKQTEIGVLPDEWNLDEVKNIAVIKTGNRNTQDRIEDGDYPFYVRSQVVERINTYTFDGEAVLTAGDGVGVGKVIHYVNEKFDCHQRVYRISNFSEDINGYFFYVYFKSRFLNRVMQMTAKSSVDSVRMEMIADMQIPIPPTKAEQTAIANALSDADAYINSLEKLIEKKRNIKQGLVKQLLSGNKRLAGYKGDWIKKPFKEVCWFQEGPGLRNWQFTKDGIKVINVTNLEDGYLNLDRTTRHISWSEFEKMYKHFEIDAGDIVVASSGNSYAKVAIVRERDLPLVMNTSVIRFKPLKNLDYNFLLFFLKSNYFKEQIDLLITGGAQPNFGPFHLDKINISLPPTKEEQIEVAQILFDIESELEGFEQKLIKAKNIKQGMMQELLTGKIRLV